MSVLFTDAHEEQRKKQEKFFDSEMARTQITCRSLPTVNGKFQTRSRFSRSVISNTWRKNHDFKDLDQTGKYVDDVKNNEIAVFSASGMSLIQFQTMRDSVIAHFEKMKHVHTFDSGATQETIMNAWLSKDGK